MRICVSATEKGSQISLYLIPPLRRYSRYQITMWSAFIERSGSLSIGHAFVVVSLRILMHVTLVKR